MAAVVAIVAGLLLVLELPVVVETAGAVLVVPVVAPPGVMICSTWASGDFELVFAEAFGAP